MPNIEQLNDFIIAKQYMLDLYKQHINECDSPNETLELLDRYEQSQFLDDDVLEMIEADYPVKTIKEVAAKVAVLENQMLSKQIKTRLSIKYNFLSIILILVSLLLIYNFFFRYEYKIQKGPGYNSQVIKIDKLTGKTSFTVPEYAEQKKK